MLVMMLCEPHVNLGSPLIKRIINNYVPAATHIYTYAQPAVLNTVTRTLTLTHTPTRTDAQ